MPWKLRINRRQTAVIETTIVKPLDPFIPTRQSLLSRLKDLDDQDSWKVFFDTYWRIIYNAAVRAGLSDAEARDVVQETILSVSRKLPGFDYDPAKGSFKGWLLTVTRWRIADQFRKRGPGSAQPRHQRMAQTSTSRTATVERLADPADSALEALWDREWERTLLKAALERAKKKADSRDYQAFDLCVNQGVPFSEVARLLRLSRLQVYRAKYRVKKLVEQEIASLKNKLL